MPDVTYTTNAPKYMAAFREAMRDEIIADPEVADSYNRMIDVNDIENYGSESVAYMRFHLVLQEMHPLIQLMSALGSESPFIAMYKHFCDVQQNVSTEELEAIKVESMKHAGITEEDLNA